MSPRPSRPSSQEDVRRYGESRGMSEEQIEQAGSFMEEAAGDNDPRFNIPRRYEYGVFPIIAVRRTGEGPVGPINANPNVQGTATMLSASGLFCTSGHCVNVAFGERDITGQQAHDPNDYALFVFDNDQRVFKIAMVKELSISPAFDLAFGRADLPGRDSPYPRTLGIGTAKLGKGSAVFGLGYPETRIEDDDVGGVLKVSFIHRRYQGKIEAWQRGIVPWYTAPKANGYQHTINTPPGFSGGPMIRTKTDLVHGLMTGGFSSFGGPGFALDASIIADGWKVPMFGDLTLREYAMKNPREGIVVRGDVRGA